MMDLYIETLTGTSFELRVSSYETIQDVKARIQKLEGIPISQQHLIWRSCELDDDYSLRDYAITDGTTLKLVLTLRGGPINTRRIPIEDSTLRDISDYIAEVSDGGHAHDAAASLASELLASERHSNGSKPVTLIVYQNGDLLTFYRIDSDSNSPSESLSATYLFEEDQDTIGWKKIYSGTFGSLDLEDDPEEEDSPKKCEDNVKTQLKMRSLKEKMRNYLPQKSKLTEVIKTPSLKKSTTKSTLCHSPTMLYPLTSPLTAEVTAKPQTSVLRPGSSSQSASTTTTTSRVRHLTSASRGKQTRLSPIGITAAGGGGSASTISPPSAVGEPDHDLFETEDVELLTRVKSPNGGAPTGGGGGSGGVASSSAYLQRQASDGDSSNAVETLDSILRRRRWGLLPLNETPSASATSAHHSHHLHHHHPHHPQHHPQHHSMVMNKPSSLRRLLSNNNLPAGQTSSSSTAEANIGSDGSETGNRGHPSVLGGLIRSGGPGVGGSKYGGGSSDDRYWETNSSNLYTGEQNPIVKIPSKTPRLPPVLAAASSTSVLVSNGHGKRAKSKRCYLCTKKTGLATSYICRCGNNYCSMHRYAESHSCTYNYKLEGRKLLEQTNPVVTAPKLPKI